MQSKSAVAGSQFNKFVHILYPEHKVSGNLGLGSGCKQRVGLGVPCLAYYVELVHFGLKHTETESKLACIWFCCFGSVL